MTFERQLFLLRLTTQLAGLNGPAERGHEVLTVDRLSNEVAGPAPEGMNHQVGLAVSADHERWRVRATGSDLGQELEAVHPRHLDIGDDRVVVSVGDPVQRGSGG